MPQGGQRTVALANLLLDVDDRRALTVAAIRLAAYDSVAGNPWMSNPTPQRPIIREPGLKSKA
jgi:hypothetical protein